MKIASFVFAILVMLGGFSIMLSAQQVWEKHDKVIQDEQSAALAVSKSIWLEGTVALSFERSVTQVALALDDPIPSDFRALIEEQRGKSDALFAETLSRLASESTSENAAEFQRRVTEARKIIAALRREADVMLASGAADRDGSRVADLPYELKKAIENLYASATLLALPDTVTSAEEIMLTRVQALAWEIREYGGRARTFYAIATLTGRPIPNVVAGEARIDTGRAKAAWHQLQLAMQAFDPPADLVEAIAVARENFAETYLRSLDQLDAAMDEMRAGVDRTMPLDFGSFFALSNDGLDAVAGLAPLAGTEIYRYWEGQISASRMTRLLNILAMLVLSGLMALAIFALQRKLVRPLLAMSEVIQRIASGDLEREFRKKSRGLDEMKSIWDGLSTMTATLREVRENAKLEREAERAAKEGVIGDLLIGLEKMAEGDLTHQIENCYGPAYEALVTNYNATTVTLRGLVSDVVDTAGDIADRSVELSAAIEDLSRRTDAQSDYLARTVGNLSEFSDNIRETADSVGQSDAYAGRATDEARSSQEIVDGAVEAMRRIKSSSQEINQFTAVIDEIAFQTGLLALNAGVEAARAGNAGTGFAVVAHEIRDLAQRASESSAEIKGVIQQSVRQVETGSRQVIETGQSLEDIVEMVQEISKRIAAISSASQDQRTGVDEIGATMDQLDDMTKKNADMVERATRTSSTLQEKAHALRVAVERFSVEDPSRAAPQLRAA
ncbi:MAG: methyl-accepting chemotaxis protein [Pseudomonadota bacterium]